MNRPGLRRSALAGISTTVAYTLTLAILWPSIFRMGASYLAGTLAVCIVGGLMALWRLERHHPHSTIGAANHITLARGALIALLGGLATGRAADTRQIEVATGIAALALLLDGVDGWLARRYRTSSEFGARFDMESDALLILILSILTWQLGKAGSWVLLSGLLRYIFVLACMGLPELRRPLPASRRRKSIAVIQAIALICAIAPVVARGASAAVAATALLLLVASFLIDIVWLLQQRRVPFPGNQG